MGTKLEEAQKLKAQYEAALNAAKQEFVDRITAKKNELKKLEAEYEKLYGPATKMRRRRRTKAEMASAKAKPKVIKPMARKPARGKPKKAE